jgi:hypothetical protein
MSILGLSFDGISGKILSEAIEIFINKNSLKVFPVAWEMKEKYLVLKLNLWFDRAPNVITSIELDDKVNNIQYSHSDFNISEEGGMLSLIDASNLYTPLQKFEHYNGGIFSLSPENPKSISIVFRINESTSLNNLDLLFKIGNSNISYNLKELLTEIPKINDLVRSKGHDPEATLKILGLI